MKKLLLFLSGLLTSNAFAVIPISYGNQIFGISNSNGTLLVAGDSGYIFYKSATGPSWRSNSSSLKIHWRSIASSTDGYDVVGGHGALAYARTTTAGTSAWDKIAVPGTSGVTSYYKLISGPDSNNQQHFLAIGDAPVADQHRGNVLYQAATNNITNWSRVAANIGDANNNPNVVDVAAGNKQFMALDGAGYAWISNDAVNWTKINQQICNTSQFKNPQVIGGGNAFYVLCVNQHQNNAVTLNVYSYKDHNFGSSPITLKSNYDPNTSYTMALSGEVDNPIYQESQRELIILENSNGYATTSINGTEVGNDPVDRDTTLIDKALLTRYHVSERYAGTAYTDEEGHAALMFIGSDNKTLSVHLDFRAPSVINYN